MPLPSIPAGNQASTEEQLDAVFERWDTDGNGKIDYEEFALFMKKLGGAVGKGKF